MLLELVSTLTENVHSTVQRDLPFGVHRGHFSPCLCKWIECSNTVEILCPIKAANYVYHVANTCGTVICTWTWRT